MYNTKLGMIGCCILLFFNTISELLITFVILNTFIETSTSNGSLLLCVDPLYTGSTALQYNILYVCVSLIEQNVWEENKDMSSFNIDPTGEYLI
jgi:hypothetical protein